MLGWDISSRGGNDTLSCFMLQNLELNMESYDPVGPSMLWMVYLENLNCTSNQYSEHVFFIVAFLTGHQRKESGYGDVD